MSNPTFKKLRPLVVTAVVLGLVGLAIRVARRPASEEVTLGVAALRISLPVFVAAERGVFARHGLRVNLKSYPTAQPMIDDVALGRLDAGGFAAWPIVLLASARAPEGLRVAGAIHEDSTHRLSYVLAKRGAGLQFPRDVAGRRVGVLPTVAYRRWLAAILAEARIDPASVTVVPVEPSMQAQSLEAGAVDMMFTGDPMATAMLARGIAEIVDDGPPCARRISDPFSFGTVAYSEGFVRRSPDLARRLAAALDEAIEIARRDPAGAREAMRRHLRADEQPFVDRYPDTRYETSQEFHGLAAVIAANHALGTIDRAPRVNPL